MNIKVKKRMKLLTLVFSMFFIIFCGEQTYAANASYEGRSFEENVQETIKEYVGNYYDGIYSFSEFAFTFGDAVESEDGEYQDIIVNAERTLVRNSCDSPFVKGMISEIDKMEEAARLQANGILEEYLAVANRYYLVPVPVEMLFRLRLDNGICVLSVYNEDEGTMNEVSMEECFEDTDAYEEGKYYILDRMYTPNARGAVTISGYNANAAVQYAIAHAMDDPEFCTNNDSDCANFVSKCINAGGISVDWDGEWHPATTWGNSGTAGRNWMRTGYNPDRGGVIPYFVGKGYIQETDISHAVKGDILFWNDHSHVAIVTYCQNGTIKYSQHSSTTQSSVYRTYTNQDVKVYHFI